MRVSLHLSPVVHPPFDPPKLTVFTQVTQDEISKIISKYYPPNHAVGPIAHIPY